MKRRPKKAKTREDERAESYRSGFCYGVEVERAGTVARLRVCGLDDLADALESDNGFEFAVTAYRLRDHSAARKRARERADSRPRPTVERQLGLFDGGTGSGAGARARSAMTRASISRRSSVSGSSSRKARMQRS